MTSEQHDPASDPYADATIKVMPGPDPIAVMRAYREHISDTKAAWSAACAVTREANPAASEETIKRRTMLALGARELIGDYADTLGQCSPGGMPCWVDGPAAFFRLHTATRHVDMSVDELVSRIVNAWVLAACDFDGKPVEGIPAPSSKA